MIFPVCDAQMIADYTPTMTQSQYEEVIDKVHAMGGIDDSYAAKLLALINEAYRSRDVQAWAKEKCGGSGPDPRTGDPDK